VLLLSEEDRRYTKEGLHQDQVQWTNPINIRGQQFQEFGSEIANSSLEEDPQFRQY
jgi:hypothetical protein